MESSLRRNYAVRWFPDEQGNFMPIPAIYTGFSTDPVANAHRPYLPAERSHALIEALPLTICQDTQGIIDSCRRH